MDDDIQAATWLSSLANVSDQDSDFDPGSESDDSDATEGSLESLDLKERTRQSGKPNLPRSIGANSTPFKYFQLFFSDRILLDIVDATNEYARQKDAGEGRKWTPLTAQELRIWLGIQIYMGIVRLPSTELYWQVTNNVLPTHPPTKSMTSVRWHQIKRYIKVSSQQMESKSTVWFSKTEPIFSHLNSMFKKF
jgi:hypothetical protein